MWSILFLLIQLVCILLLFVHTLKKYAPDIDQCTHSFSTTISNVERVTVYRSQNIVFDTSDGKVFFNVDTGFSLDAGKIIDEVYKEFRYLSDNGTVVNIRIRNEPDNNVFSGHYKEYEMVALNDNQTQIEEFESTQKLGVVVFSVLLSLWLAFAIGFYIIFRI